MNNPKLIGAVLGLTMGIIVLWLGPLEAFIVALFGLGGWLIGKYLAGEIPILDTLLRRFLDSRSRGRR